MRGYLFFLSVLLLNACENVHIDAAKNLANPLPDSNPVNTLVWNYPSPVLRAGESIPFSFSNGGTTYTTDPFGIGTFDSSTLIYTVPFNQAPMNHTISAEDETGLSGTNPVKITGFQTGERFQFPQTFGDQNYIRSSAVLDNGAIFTAAVVIDSPGWERWIINRSLDEGLTWQQVDQYVPFENGESHPMAMINKGNDLYVCGYIWENSSTSFDSEWVVKKSSDNGASWIVVDRYAEHSGDNHVCYDITVAANGNLYAVGYNDTDGGVVRESSDDGATWTTIGKVLAARYLVTVEVSPAGVIWTVDYYGRLRKGTYSLGVWNWTDDGAVTGVLTNGAYELYGDLEIISENEVYFSGNSNFWKIFKTVDGGVSWSEVYTGPTNRYKGQDIKRLSTGEIVAIGTLNKTLSSDPDTFKIIRSTDNGSSWNEVYSSSSPSSEGVTLIETASSVMAFGVFDGEPNQIINLRSTDAGASWTNRSVIYFIQNLYSYINDFKVDSLGNLWAAGDLYFIDDSYLTPWSVIKSTDDGANWTNSDLFPGTTHNAMAEALAIGPSNEVYVAGHTDNNDIIKKTTNSGTSWSIVDTNAGVLSYNKKIVSDGTGNIYMAGTIGSGANSILRKGTVNGTVWNTIVTFPIEPGHTNFSLLGLNVFSDDSIWVAGRERNTTPVFTTVIYRSDDGGVSFTEVFRSLEVNWRSMSIKMASNGDVYAHTLYKVIKTSDNGATWEDVYDGTLAGARINGFQFDNLGRLYVLNDDDQVLAQNQFDNSWFVMYDYSLINLISGRYLDQITDCGNMSQVCLISHYDISVTGAVNEMIPLVTP